MIRRVSITNFKAITKLEFEPHTLNIFVGRNNTGKSTVLEAIALACSSPRFEDVLGTNLLAETLERSERQLIRFDADYCKISVELDFGHTKEIEILPGKRVHKLSQDILESILSQIREYVSAELESEIRRIEFRMSALERRIEIAKRRGDETEVRWLENRLRELQSKYSKLATMRELEVNKKVREYLNKSDIILLHKFDNEIISITLAGEYGYRTVVLKEYEDIPVIRVLRRYADDIEEFVRHVEEESPSVLDEVILKLRYHIPELVNIRTKGDIIPRVYVSLKYGDNVKVVPLSSMGDGFKALLELYLLLNLIKREGVILIEEPEIRLHPGYMNLFVELLVNQIEHKPPVKLFLTTHSIEFLKLLAETLQEHRLIDELLVIRTYRYNDGTIDYEVLTGQDVTTELLELEQDLRGI